MKTQDIIFFIIFIVLLYKKDFRFFTIAGIVSLILSIPLFTFWVFFTAERLTWYAAFLFSLAALISMFNIKK